MSHIYRAGFIHAPFFALAFRNASRSVCRIWFAFNGKWRAAPLLHPGQTLLPVPILEGFLVDWRIISEAEIEHYNREPPGSYDSQVEAILSEDRFIKCQGSFSREGGQLGRGIGVELL